MRDLDLTSLRLFVAVCDSGSMSRAAEQAHMVASAVSKRLAQLMGGSLTVRSQVGQGSVFRFEIPLMLAEAAPVQAPDAEHDWSGGVSVLLAEDHVVNQRIVRMMLEPFGATVTIAANGVTGSCHRYIARDNLHLLVDCGLFQGVEAGHSGSIDHRIRFDLACVSTILDAFLTCSPRVSRARFCAASRRRACCRW